MPPAKTLNDPYISIIVPAYKQEKTIIKTLHRLETVLKSLNKPYEIICVVDGFLDKTFEKTKSISTNNIKVIGYPNNSGKGFAVRYGMAHSTGRIIGFVDSGELDYGMIPMMLEHFNWYKADAIIASKRHPVSQVTYPWQRKILSWGYQIGVKLLFGLNVRDTQVGMKLYRKELIKAVLPRLLVKKFAFDIEILAVAHCLGFTKIYEAPVKLSMKFLHTSSIFNTGFIKTAFNMAWDSAAVFYRLKILHYYDDSNRKNWLPDTYLDG